MITRVTAYQRVARAKKSGKLKPLSELKCVDCGAQAVHYDHRDYQKPLDVEPVCQACNIKRGEGANKSAQPTRYSRPKDHVRVGFAMPWDVLTFARKAAKAESLSIHEWIIVLIRQEMAAEKQNTGIKKHEIN